MISENLMLLGKWIVFALCQVLMNAQKFWGKDKGWKFLSKIWELMIDGVVMSPRKYKIWVRGNVLRCIRF